MRELTQGLLFALMLCLAAPASASSNGISLHSGDPDINSGLSCNICHTGGLVPTVTLGGPLSVEVGTVATYELTVSGGQRSAAGLDVSATDGTLIVTGPDTQILDGEVTHTAPRAVDGLNQAIFLFDWQAPAAPGSVTLYGAGNSVDGMQGPGGDAAALVSLQISVTGPALTPGESSGAGLAPLLVTGYDKQTGELTLSYDTACEATGNNVYYGPLAQVSTYAYSGATCDVGNSGVTPFDPGPGSFFFLVVGNRAADEGSYGLDEIGGVQSERPDFVGNPCGPVQTLAASCD